MHIVLCDHLFLSSCTLYPYINIILSFTDRSFIIHKIHNKNMQFLFLPKKRLIAPTKSLVIAFLIYLALILGKVSKKPFNNVGCIANVH